MKTKGDWREWVEAAEASPEFAVENAKIEFAVAIQRRMDQLGVNRSELARMLGTSGAAVSTTLRGDTNVTIDRMVRYAYALDAELHLHVAPRTTGVRWMEIHQGSRQADELRHYAATTWARQPTSDLGEAEGYAHAASN